jgi:Polyketide cyclase / dehydrase and lipid transport
VEHPTRMKSRAVEGKLRFEVTNTFEAQNGGTHFTYRVEADPGLGGVFGRLADPLVEKAQRRTVRANLETLAELLTHPAGWVQAQSQIRGCAAHLRWSAIRFAEYRRLARR